MRDTVGIPPNRWHDLVKTFQLVHHPRAEARSVCYARGRDGYDNCRYLKMKVDHMGQQTANATDLFRSSAEALTHLGGLRV